MPTAGRFCHRHRCSPNFASHIRRWSATIPYRAECWRRSRPLPHSAGMGSHAVTPRRLPCALAAVLVLALLAGCGSRVSGAEVLAAGGGASVTVTLPPDVVQSLQQAAGRRMVDPPAPV